MAKANDLDEFHKNAEALQLLERLLESRRDEQTLRTAAILSDAGVQAILLEDLNLAYRYQQSALRIQEALAPGSIALATTLLGLGNVANGRGDFAAAESLDEQALRVREKVDPDSMGPPAYFRTLPTTRENAATWQRRNNSTDGPTHSSTSHPRRPRCRQQSEQSRRDPLSSGRSHRCETVLAQKPCDDRETGPAPLVQCADRPREPRAATGRFRRSVFVLQPSSDARRGARAGRPESCIGSAGSRRPRGRKAQLGGGRQVLQARTGYQEEAHAGRDADHAGSSRPRDACRRTRRSCHCDRH